MELRPYVEMLRRKLQSNPALIDKINSCLQIGRLTQQEYDYIVRKVN